MTAKSAYISSEVFAAEIQDDGAQIDGSSGGSNNLAGVMVSYNTLDNEDSDLFHSGGNDSMPGGHRIFNLGLLGDEFSGYFT